MKDNKVYDVENKWLQSRGIIASESMAEDLEKIAESKLKIQRHLGNHIRVALYF